jgi:catechol 2,3-dioxygenase-like lactoylglutathione lyase family enzyme
MAEFRAVFPVVEVRSVPGAVRFYTEGLGFGLRFQDDPADPKYAGVERGAVCLHLQFHQEEDFQGDEGPEFRLLVDGVDGLFEEYRSRGVVPEGREVRDTPWGTREFALHDPDGNGLIFFRGL